MTRPLAALTIAGSDSSGGAGIQADLKTFTALGVYGASAITALTAQNTAGVSAIHIPPAQFTRQQIVAVIDDLEVSATKTGMLPDAATVTTLCELLDQRPQAFGPLIVDPVVIATSGDRLINDQALEVLRARLLPRATLVTPNRAEAALLAGDDACADTIDEILDQARRILALGPAAVLMKGGHAGTAEATDLLITPVAAVRLSTPRIDTPNTHGTGCTLSAAIAARLASRGWASEHTGPLDGEAFMSLAAAVREAKAYLTAALKAGRSYTFGVGSGPVDHIAAAPDRSAGTIDVTDVDMQPVTHTPVRP